MTHNVRAGVQVNRSYMTEQQVYSGGVRYQTTNGVPTQALVTNPAESTGETKTAGLWVEDEINLFQRLTIQPGVRYDWTKSISPDSNIIAGNDLIERGHADRQILHVPHHRRDHSGPRYALYLEHLVSAGRRQLEADQRRQDRAARHDRTLLPPVVQQ